MVQDKKEQFSDLKPDQKATLFPSLGYYDANQSRWRAYVHGRVFIDSRIPLGTKLLLSGLKRAMKASPEDYESEIFKQRIYGFLAAPGRRRKIVLDVAGHHFRLRRRTRRNGAFYGRLTLPTDVERLFEAGESVLPMRLHQSTDAIGTIGETSGELYLVKPRGVSVISDIDDTIKLTEATSKKQLLANTFLRPFEVVQGMSNLYQAWMQAGCQFHYVSSSPWQLYEPLAELCRESEFPPGSMHLRYFNVRDEMLKRYRPVRRNAKVGIIARLFRTMPERRYVLVGDSGEKDPEIYRFLAKRFPQQVAAILIRDLADKPMDSKRKQKLEVVPRGTHVHVFQETAEIEKVVFGLLAN